MPEVTHEVDLEEELADNPEVTREELLEAIDGFTWFLEWVDGEIRRALTQGYTQNILQNILGRIKFPHSTPLAKSRKVVLRLKEELILDDAAQDIADHALADETNPEVLNDIREAAEIVSNSMKCGRRVGILYAPSDFESMFVRELVSRGMSEGKAIATVDLVKLKVCPHTMSAEDLEKFGPVDGKHGEIHMMEFRPEGSPPRKPVGPPPRTMRDSEEEPKR